MLLNIQALRAFAAILVVLHHMRTPLLKEAPTLGEIHIGAAGVDIFFVISGFIITHTAAQRPVTPAQFLIQRALRIVPLYWLFLLIVAVMLAAGMRPIGLTDTDATFLNLLRSLSFIPFERSDGAVMPLLGVGWTLNYEVFFYLLFGISLCLPDQNRLPAVTLCLLALPSLGWLLAPTSAVASFFTNPILLEFLAGCWLAHWYANAPRSCANPNIGWLMISSGVVGLALPAIFDWNAAFEQLMPLRFILFGLPALAIVAGALCLERACITLRAPFWQLQGAASYAIYVSHILALQTVEKALIVTGLVNVLGPVPKALIFLVSAIAVGTAIHLWLERPLTKMLRSRLLQPHPTLLHR